MKEICGIQLFKKKSGFIMEWVNYFNYKKIRISCIGDLHVRYRMAILCVK